MREEKIGILIDLIKNNMALLKRVFHQCFFVKNEKLSRHQIFCLHFLSNCGTLSMSGLAEESGISNQQLTRIVDGLVENGYVDRFVSPENRRIVLVELSENGKRFIEESNEIIKKRTVELLNPLSINDLESTIKYLQGLEKIIARLEGLNRE